MNGPRRLREHGGAFERLLESATIDKPSRASRHRALEFVATAGAFSSTTAGVANVTAARRADSSPAFFKTVATWVGVGAALGLGTAFIAAQALDSSTSAGSSAARATAAPLLGPETPTSPPAAAAPPVPMAELTPSVAPPPPPTPAVAVKPSSAKLSASVSVSPSLPSSASAPALVPAPGAVNELEAARQAVARGDCTAALDSLDKYDAQNPNGAFKAESAALRVQAVSGTGNISKAQRLANEFEQQYPRHPLSGQVRDAAKMK